MLHTLVIHDRLSLDLRESSPGAPNTTIKCFLSISSADIMFLGTVAGSVCNIVLTFEGDVF